MWNSSIICNDLFPKIFYYKFRAIPNIRFQKSYIVARIRTYTNLFEGCRKTVIKLENAYICIYIFRGHRIMVHSCVQHGSIVIIVFLTPPTQWVGQVKCAHTNHVPGQRTGGPKMYWRNANYARITMPGSHSRPDATGHSAWCCPTAGMRGPWMLERARFPGPRIDHPRYTYTRRCRCRDTISPCSWPCSWFSAVLCQVNGNFATLYSRDDTALLG